MSVAEDLTEFRRAQAAQALAADPTASAWVAANAGSGKTKVLIDRVARLLLRGAAPDSILCVTYTKAAASEMLSRLFDRLGSWSVMQDDDLRIQLGGLEARAPGTYTAEELRRARSLFARALETPGGLRIETLHAFCARVLKRFPLEAGIAPGFVALEDVDADRLWTEAVEALLVSDDANLQSAIDTVALAAGGRGLDGPLKSVRAQSTGLMRFAVRHGGASDAMTAALKDGLKAPDRTAEALLADAWAKFPRAEIQALLSDLTAAEADLKKDDRILRAGLSRVLAAETAQDWFDAMGELVFTTQGTPRKRLYNAAGRAAGGSRIETLFSPEVPEGIVLQSFVRLVEDLKRRNSFERTDALVRLGLAAIARYNTLKASRAALDFDDLITATNALLSEPGAGQWVLYKLDGNLSHVLLDEAQDTSPAQWSLIRALTEEFFAGEAVDRFPPPRTQFTVGDEKQSIYSFQGAAPETFGGERASFLDRVHATGQIANQPQMAMSFRSAPQILAFVDAVCADLTLMAQDPSEPAPPPGADLPIRHTAFRTALPGSVTLRDIEPKRETAERDPYLPVDAEPEDSPRKRLADWIASDCQRMIEAGESVHGRDGSARPMQAGDILILVQNRTGGLFDALIGALKARGLPVAGADRLVLSDHIGVQDTLNLARFALCPANDLAVAELLKSPFLNLVDDQADLFPLAHGRANGETLWQRLKDTSDHKYQGAQDFLQHCLATRALAPFDFLSRALGFRFGDGTTARDRLIARLGTPVKDPLEALLNAALSLPQHGPESLQHLVAKIETTAPQIKRDLARADGEIRVMTVHGAKGLEAPVVILADTTRPVQDRASGLAFGDTGLPAWLTSAREDCQTLEILRARAKARSEAEHARLLYVALTRAEERLIICGAHHGSGQAGFGESTWYARCLSALDVLGPRDITPQDGLALKRFGPNPEALGADTTGADGVDELPTWALSPARDLPETTPWRLAPSSLTDATRAHPGPFAVATPSRRFRRGLLVHRLLEHLPQHDPAEAERIAQQILAPEGLDADDIADLLATAQATLDHPAMRALLAHPGRAEAPISGRIDAFDPPMIVSGRVDRLVLAPDRTFILDYKTDRPGPTTPEAVDPAYLVQMAAYRAVMQQARPGVEVSCVLVWTDGPMVMPLSSEILNTALTNARGALQPTP